MICPFLSQAATSYNVYVGYNDSVRASPFTPSPYSNADVFQGNTDAPLDTGAIRIENTGTTTLTLTDLKVTMTPGINPIVIQLWNFNPPVKLKPRQNAVFASTANYNFDSSDYQFLGSASVSDNCSTGPSAATTLCTSNAPVVSLTVNGALINYTDTGHVLDTGGFDLATAGLNESMQWRIVGTTGLANPGLGGDTTGSTVTNVLCQNITTGKKVTLKSAQLLSSQSWDCAARGLLVNTGDVIKQTVTSTAN